MAERLIPLDAWARRKYGEHMPSVWTLRAWARDAKIVPLPKKHGRSYYVAESAEYIHPNDPAYLKALRESAKAQ